MGRPDGKNLQILDLHRLASLKQTHHNALVFHVVVFLELYGGP